MAASFVIANSLYPLLKLGGASWIPILSPWVNTSLYLVHLWTQDICFMSFLTSHPRLPWPSTFEILGTYLPVLGILLLLENFNDIWASQMIKNPNFFFFFFLLISSFRCYRLKIKFSTEGISGCQWKSKFCACILEYYSEVYYKLKFWKTNKNTFYKIMQSSTNDFWIFCPMMSN